MDASLSRAQLLSRGAKSGTVILWATSVAAAFAQPAAAEAIPDGDLAYARLLVGAELDPVGISFPSPLTIEQASDVLDAHTS
jgi:hypothetical protein